MIMKWYRETTPVRVKLTLPLGLQVRRTNPAPRPRRLAASAARPALKMVSRGGNAPQPAAASQDNWEEF
jgi:hypothetical protein